MEPIKLLDHGYLRFIECWGSGDAGVPEAGIIESARQSTQGSFRGWEADQKLLNFLFSSKPQHAGPFEFAGMVVEVQAPIFVFREWQRHRTQSYNEMSARYSPLPDLHYIPSVERIMADSGGNRQAGAVAGSDGLSLQNAESFQYRLIGQYANQQSFYDWALKAGVPKELARLVCPVGRYSRMRACANLRNWLAFLTLRSDPAAQWEIRQYADAIGGIIGIKFPRTWELFRKGNGK